MAYVLDRPLTRTEAATFLESGADDGLNFEDVEELAATHGGHGLEDLAQIAAGFGISVGTAHAQHGASSSHRSRPARTPQQDRVTSS
ncbi:hypothetical protein ACF061_05355 [Streptomyces sp. NPDC015220]|uniref:hypothetical protein n=1 Tax=Streptomyces sp. NPDC015220 TaxID=3364947 RepID=UPI0036F5A798